MAALALVLATTPVLAATYYVVESNSLIYQAPSSPRSEGWKKEDVAFGEQVHTVTIEPGLITIDGHAFFQLALTLTEANALLDQSVDDPVLDDGTGRYGSGMFPFSPDLVGPQTMEIFQSVPENQPIFFLPFKGGCDRFLLPGRKGLLSFCVSIFHSSGDEVLATANLFALKPATEELEFSEAEVHSADLLKGLRFSEAEARAALAGEDANRPDEDDSLIFSEDEVILDNTGHEYSLKDLRQDIEKSPHDWWKLLGCAAELTTCPQGIMPDTLRDYLQLGDGDVLEEHLRNQVLEIFRERRAAEKRQGK